MKLYREVLCSERLPDKESNYFAILKSGEYSFYRFNPGESIDKLWFQKSVDVWLEQLPEQKVGEEKAEYDQEKEDVYWRKQADDQQMEDNYHELPD